MNKLEIGIVAILALGGTMAWAQSLKPDFFVPDDVLENQPASVNKPIYREKPIRAGGKGITASSKFKSKSGKKQAARRDPRVKEFDHNFIGEPGFRHELMDNEQKPTVDTEIANTKQEIKQPEEKIIKVEPPAKEVYSPEDGLGDGLIKDRDYQDKLTTYEKDLLAISETGKAPDNPQLKSDLDAMNSNMSFSVQ